jgi:hypothetical protein
VTGRWSKRHGPIIGQAAPPSPTSTPGGQESFPRRQTSYLRIDTPIEDTRSSDAHLNRRTFIVTIAVYLIAAAVVVCGCLFIMRARSRD